MKLPNKNALNLGGVSDPAKSPTDKSTKDADQENELFVRQQAILTSHRKNLRDFTGGLKSGESTLDDVRESFHQQIGKLHINDWNSLWPLIDALCGLGDEFHRGAFVFGGWHHQGDLSKLSAPPQDLLDDLKAFRMVLRAGSLRDALVGALQKNEATPNKVTADVLADAQVGLGVHLSQWPKLFSPDGWKQLLELEKQIEKRTLSLSSSIETKLLFLENRVFVFSPTATDALTGWKDFARFVYAYRRLRFDITKYKNYYIGIYLTKS